VVASMTGFARTSFSLAGMTYTVEIRTLNHKYLDIHCRLPETLTAAEMPLRNLLKEYISRGRVDLRITAEYQETESALELNEAVYQAYLRIIAQMTGDCRPQALDPVAMLALPNMLRSPVQDPGVLLEPLLDNLRPVLQRLREDREREGSVLWRDISARLDGIGRLVEELEALARQQQEEVAQRLKERLGRLGEELDDARIITEIAILADKADINEELVRLKAHIQEFGISGREEGPVGRRLEFIGQEMLREINTIAAKSAVYQISKYAVDIKTELEKIREQVQNIE